MSDTDLEGTQNAPQDNDDTLVTPGDETGEVLEGVNEDAEIGGEGDAAGAQGLEVEPEPQGVTQPQSRAQERIRRQQEELHRERTRAETAERERQELMRQLEEQRTRAEQQRQQQYLDSLDPTERQAYITQQQLEQMRREMQQQQFVQADMMDKIAFQQRALQNPMVGKYVDRVEETLQAMRAKGNTAPRESVLKFLIGEEVLNKGPAIVAKAAKAASKPAEKPLRARGNASAGAKDEDADLEERLSKITF